MLIFLIVLGVVLGLPLLLHTFGYFFVGKALPEASACLHSDDDIEVSLKPWVVFRSRGAIRAGLILHPGGYVDAEAYAQIISHVARHGVLCVIVPGPYRTPIADRFAADRVIAHYPEIKDWFIAGHSQGGAVANLYIRDRWPNDSIKGLIYLGYYSSPRHSLAHINLPTLTVFGTRDGRAERFEPCHVNLPEPKRIVKIEGGNHGQFGAYGLHFGDQTAEIPRTQQQAIAQTAIVEFIDEVLAR